MRNNLRFFLVHFVAMNGSRERFWRTNLSKWPECDLLSYISSYNNINRCHKPMTSGLKQITGWAVAQTCCISQSSLLFPNLVTAIFPVLRKQQKCVSKSGFCWW